MAVQLPKNVIFYHVTTRSFGLTGSLDKFPRHASLPVIVVFDVSGKFVIPTALQATIFSSLTDVYFFGNTSPGGVLFTGETSKITIDDVVRVQFHHITFAILPPHKYSGYGQPYPDPLIGTYDEPDVVPYFVNIAPRSHYDDQNLTNPHQVANSWDAVSISSSYNKRQAHKVEFHHCSFMGTTDDYNIGNGTTGPNGELAQGSKDCVFYRCIFSHAYGYRRVDVKIFTDSATGTQWARLSELVSEGVFRVIFRDKDGNYYPTDEDPFISTDDDPKPPTFSETHFHLTEVGHNLNALAYRADNIQYINNVFADGNRRSPQISNLSTFVPSSIVGAALGNAIKDYGTSAVAFHTKGPCLAINNLFYPTTVGSTSRYYGCISIQSAGAPIRASYSTGTIASVDGLVTLSGGTFPTMNPGDIWDLAINVGQIQGTFKAYRVKSSPGGTSLTLFDTSVNLSAGTAYSLFLSPRIVALYIAGNKELARSSNDVILANGTRFYSASSHGTTPHNDPFPGSTLSQGTLGTNRLGLAPLVGGLNLAGPVGFDINLNPLPNNSPTGSYPDINPPFLNHIGPSPLTPDYQRDLFQNRDSEIFERPIQRFSSGTISSVGPVITLSGASFPTWINSTSKFQILNVDYNVASRDSDSQCTLASAPPTLSNQSFTVFDNGWQIPRLDLERQAPAFLPRPPASFVPAIPEWELNPANLLAPGQAGTKFCHSWEQSVFDAFNASPPNGPVIPASGPHQWYNGETFSLALPSIPNNSAIAKTPDPQLPLSNILNILSKA